MQIPVQPLDVTDEGITAGVSINRTRHVVHIPWCALICAIGPDGVEHLVNHALNHRVLTMSPEHVSRAAAVLAQAQLPPKRAAAVERDGNVVRVDFTARRRA